jgi:hypothetical protein
VGFHIYRLKFYECQDFKVYFNLWSGGGANWQQELANFEKEEQDSWVSVHREKNLKPSFADVVKKVKLTGANSTNIRNPQWQSKLGTSLPTGSQLNSLEPILPTLEILSGRASFERRLPTGSQCLIG